MTVDAVYMLLEGEGVDVWRPAPAKCVGSGRYVVLRPDHYDPDTARWQFPPGSTVECERKSLSGETVLAAVRAVQLDRQIA